MAQPFIPEYEKVSCSFCNGSGNHPDHGYWSNREPKPCPVCKGKGKVSVMPNVVHCAYCNGSGREPRTGGWSNTESRPCSACGGKGVQ